MELGDVARLLKVADADVESFEENAHGLFVDVRDGGRRVVTEDGLFACDDHPAGAQLRRWPGLDLPSAEPAPMPEATEVVAHPDEPVAVPEGSAEVVLSWVDGDPKRALAAWEDEMSRNKPRSTLIAALEKLASA